MQKKTGDRGRHVGSDGMSSRKLCCPSYGQVFIPESLAKGRMAEAETTLEDK